MYQELISQLQFPFGPLDPVTCQTENKYSTFWPTFGQIMPEVLTQNIPLQKDQRLFRVVRERTSFKKEKKNPLPPVWCGPTMS